MLLPGGTDNGLCDENLNKILQKHYYTQNHSKHKMIPSTPTYKILDEGLTVDVGDTPERKDTVVEKFGKFTT